MVVGPEAPLVAGLVDDLAAADIAAFGPTKAAARIEGSKAYAKELMKATGVPTAAHVLFHDRDEAAEHLACASYPAVLKADVLAAGKGVIIAADEQEARAALDVFFVEERFGDTEVVLEEFLVGEELSLLALCDGERAVPLAPAQTTSASSTATRGRTPVAWAATRRCRAWTPRWWRSWREWPTSRSSTSCAARARPSTGCSTPG